jgi:hypothetical protein
LLPWPRAHLHTRRSTRALRARRRVAAPVVSCQGLRHWLVLRERVCEAAAISELFALQGAHLCRQVGHWPAILLVLQWFDYAATMAAAAEVVKSWKCFGGTVTRYRHSSRETQTPMVFAVYLPPAAQEEAAKVPVLFFLSG